jgi:hypothetical protein
VREVIGEVVSVSEFLIWRGGRYTVRDYQLPEFNSPRQIAFVLPDSMAGPWLSQD